jgi:hypothetical protein
VHVKGLCVVNWCMLWGYVLLIDACYGVMCCITFEFIGYSSSILSRGPNYLFAWNEQCEMKRSWLGSLKKLLMYKCEKSLCPFWHEKLSVHFYQLIHGHVRLDHGWHLFRVWQSDCMEKQRFMGIGTSWIYLKN